ncbi:hypothetical protein ACH4VR_36230 [Streptomyces sp. NPDC020883]|uniref:hypothetical protein n=1 Tax=Streptomyces sp. NPDC020883 TaxID=3365099 RepID=UPI0037B090C3
MGTFETKGVQQGPSTTKMRLGAPRDAEWTNSMGNDVNFFATVARMNRVKMPDPELRYHGGPLNEQANTWPLMAVPSQIQIAERGDRPGGTYMLTSGADDADYYYSWMPAA